MPESELKEIVAKLRQAAEDLGLPSDRLLIAVTDPVIEDSDTAYEMHVGPAEDFPTASMLDHMARELAAHANFQARAVYSSDTHCPVCESVRYGRTHKIVNLRAYWWNKCLACGHTDGDLPPA